MHKESWSFLQYYTQHQRVARMASCCVSATACVASVLQPRCVANTWPSQFLSSLQSWPGCNPARMLCKAAYSPEQGVVRGPGQPHDITSNSLVPCVVGCLQVPGAAIALPSVGTGPGSPVEGLEGCGCVLSKVPHSTGPALAACHTVACIFGAFMHACCVSLEAGKQRRESR